MSDQLKYALWAISLLFFIGIGVLAPVERTIQAMLTPLGSVFGTAHVSQAEAQNLVRDARIKQLEKENTILKESLTVEDVHSSAITTRVIGHSPHTAINRITIDDGSNNDIAAGQVVLSEGVVVGVVHKVHKNQSEVLLLDDQSFRLEVAFGSERGVLKGSINGSIIDRVLPDVEIKKQTLVVTAGSREIPPNVPVGRVVGQLMTPEKVFQQIQFASPVDLDRLQYVQVIR
jgi:rod shape-determining protein MreC